MKRNIDLIKAMRTYLVVVETMSFSEASRRLNLVVSAVSRQVSDLEKHFECILLYRTTRAMKLSPEGEFYLEKFRQVIEQLDALESARTEQEGCLAGHLRITAPFNIDQLGVQHQVAAFLNDNPNVKLSWVLLNRYVNLIEEGFDLAFRVGDLEDSSFIAKKYGELGVEFVASPDYLEKHGVPAHPRELVRHQCLVDTSIRQPGRFSYSDNAKTEQVSVEGPLEVNQGKLIADFAVSGLGIAQLPSFMVRDYLNSGQLVSILKEYRLPKRDLSIVYPAAKLTNPTLRALIDSLLGGSSCVAPGEGLN